MTLRLEEWLSTTEPGLSAGSAPFPLCAQRTGEKGRAFAWRSQAKPKPLRGLGPGAAYRQTPIALRAIAP